MDKTVRPDLGRRQEQNEIKINKNKSLFTRKVYFQLLDIVVVIVVVVVVVVVVEGGAE